MNEVEIDFDDGRAGIVPVGTYLADAARRLGVANFECENDFGHSCIISIQEGSDLLSSPTEAEMEALSALSRSNAARLACYAKIEKPGVIKAMVQKKKEKATEEKQAQESSENYKKEFTELPLEKKIANLMQLEAIALGETFAFVINSPFKVFEKIGDVLAEFGFQKEEEQKRRSRPAEDPGEKVNSEGSKKRSAETGSTKEQGDTP